MVGERDAATVPTVSVSAQSARRLAVAKQHLAGHLGSRASSRSILSVIRDIAYVQWDPVTVVAPSHLLSLRARVGGFRPSQLEKLLWESKEVFLHWAPMASIVLTEDYALYHSLMSRYPESMSRSWGSQRARARKFLVGHNDLRKRLLVQLRKGPRLASEFEEHARTKRPGVEWNPNSDLTEMLYHLLMSGEVMVVGHRGKQNLWGLSSEFLPKEVAQAPLSEEEFEAQAAERALLALGVATAPEITHHFVRGRYSNLKTTLSKLVAESVIRRAVVEGSPTRQELYIHARDLPLLASLDGDAWQPRTSLLPPFDNLLGHQARTKRVFGFDYVREQFLPAERRRFGTYVLPILYGDRFIGRIDPRLDSTSRTLFINAVHAEDRAPRVAGVAEEIRSSIDDLASFVGAEQVVFSSKVPAAWKSALS